MFAPQSEDSSWIETIFTGIEVTSFQVPDIGRRGAIAAYGNTILGTDRWGNFFLFRREPDGTPVVARPRIELDTRYEEFEAYTRDAGISASLGGFRIHDLLLDMAGHRLFVSHHYWNGEDHCSTIRFSMLSLTGDGDLWSAGFSANDWKVVYETTPCLKVRKGGDPFSGLLAGGRMALVGDDQLIVTVGAHVHDDLVGAHDYPQAAESSYGKVLKIDLGNETVQVISKGHRNPQGLAIDRDGRIWITEHGPDGGDELNLIVEGGNYGFPHVIYGVAYGENTWPISEAQGRHGGYKKPIFAWVPSIGVSNLIQLRGFTPAWEGDLLVGSLYKQTLYHLRYEEGRIIFAESVLVEKEIRDIDQLEDGAIVLWSDAHEVVELRPVPRFQETVPQTVAALGDSIAEKVMSTVRGCRRCHGMSPDANDLKAPNLWKVFGRKIGGTDFGAYSVALERKSGRWNRASLDSFLLDPDSFAPGTAMESSPVRDDRIRAGVLLYLESLQ